MALSVGWGTVLAWPSAGRHPVAVGALAGTAIAALDLGLLAHGPAAPWPLIRALPVGPQVADHLAFGAIAGGRPPPPC